MPCGGCRWIIRSPSSFITGRTCRAPSSRRCSTSPRARSAGGSVGPSSCSRPRWPSWPSRRSSWRARSPTSRAGRARCGTRPAPSRETTERPPTQGVIVIAILRSSLEVSSGNYTLNLNPVADLQLQSPVPGAFSGTLSQTRNGKPCALHSNYTINNDVFGLSFHDAPSGPNPLFSKQEVYLEFTTEELLFEFVPVSAFDPAKDSYAPALKSKYSDWTKIDTPTWMGDLKDVIGERSLADLIIPGS